MPTKASGFHGRGSSLRLVASQQTCFPVGPRSCIREVELRFLGTVYQLNPGGGN